MALLRFFKISTVKLEYVLLKLILTYKSNELIQLLRKNVSLCSIFLVQSLYGYIFKANQYNGGTSFFLILWNFSFCTYTFFIQKKTANNKLYMIGIKVRDIWS